MYVCFLAVLFFTTAVGALLHFLAHYCHQLLISGIVWDHRQEVSRAALHLSTVPTKRTKLHWAPSGQKLNSVPLNSS